MILQHDNKDNYVKRDITTMTNGDTKTHVEMSIHFQISNVFIVAIIVIGPLLDYMFIWDSSDSGLIVK